MVREHGAGFQVDTRTDQRVTRVIQVSQRTPAKDETRLHFAGRPDPHILIQEHPTPQICVRRHVQPRETIAGPRITAPGSTTAEW
jgi:hypothetical protein